MHSSSAPTVLTPFPARSGNLKLVHYVNGETLPNLKGSRVLIRYLSSLRVVPTPCPTEMVAPTAPLRFTVNVSLGSTLLSPSTETVTVLLVCPGVNGGFAGDAGFAVVQPVLVRLLIGRAEDGVFDGLDRDLWFSHFPRPIVGVWFPIASTILEYRLSRYPIRLRA